MHTCTRQISNVYGRQAVVISVDPKRVYVSSAADTTHEVLDVEGAVCNSVLCWKHARAHARTTHVHAHAHTHAHTLSLSHSLAHTHSLSLALSLSRSLSNLHTHKTHTPICSPPPTLKTDGKKCWWQCTVKGGREVRDLSAFELAQVPSLSVCLSLSLGLSLSVSLALLAPFPLCSLTCVCVRTHTQACRALDVSETNNTHILHTQTGVRSAWCGRNFTQLYRYGWPKQGLR